MIERCPHCNLLGAHRYDCKRPTRSAVSVPQVMEPPEHCRTVKAGSKPHAVPLSRDRYRTPPFWPLMTPPSGVVFLFYVIIVTCIAMSVSNSEVRVALITTAAAFTVMLWLWARYSAGVSSTAGVGTQIVDTGDGHFATKWLTLIIPLIPVHTYILLYDEALLTNQPLETTGLDKYTKAAVEARQRASMPLKQSFESALRELWWEQRNTFSAKFIQRYWRGQSFDCLVCATPLRGLGLAWGQIAKTYLQTAWSAIVLVVTIIMGMVVAQLFRWLSGSK
jgi:hypothetical protein